MATTSVTIYSRYDPGKDKERFMRETGQISVSEGAVELDNEQLWREAASAQFLRAQRPPPKFVPASVSYEIGGSQPGPSKQPITQHKSHLGTSLSAWYRSLANVDDEPSSNSAYLPQPSSASILDATTRKEEVTKLGAFHPRSTNDKNNWFIQKVLQSEPSSPPCPSYTLTDILTRDPPPLPSEPKYSPPVWIEIDPSNKGFIMLQRDGWREGEALGAGVRSRPSFSDGTKETIGAKGKAVAIGTSENQVSSEVKQESCNNLGDVENEGVVDIIDLTLSDSETTSEAEEVPEHSCELPQRPEFLISEDMEDASAHGRRALLTPLATVLKLDRLGIGLKAKTEGPHKAPAKRVTHNAASLTAHVRAAEQARRKREKFGRGRRGYERQKRREEDRRRDLLAYMNT